MTEQRPLKVFLCHAKADKPAARNLYRYLRSKGMDPWLDEEKLLPGQNWRLEIPNALFASDVIIICLSKSSVDKEGYVQKEIKFALDKAMEMPEGKIFIIPALLEECDVPESLKNYHWVELFEKNWGRKLMQSLNLRAASQLDVRQAKISDDASPKLSKPESTKVEKSVERPVPQVEPHGEDSVAISGDAKETTIITGDNNIIVQSPTGEYELKPKEEKPVQKKTKQEAIFPKPSAKKEKKLTRKYDFRKIGIIGFISLIVLIGAWALIYYVINVLPVVPTTAPTSILLTKTVTSAPKPTLSRVTPTPGKGSTKISEKDGMTMVFVPVGVFTMGSNNWNVDEAPAHNIYLNSFWIDQTEVTNRMYAQCVTSGICRPPNYTSSHTRSEYFGNSQYDDYPIIYVDWNQANDYCKWVERRLPTEAEWEKAARGTTAFTYPWGNQSPNRNLLNYNNSNGNGDTTRVGIYSNGASVYGALDMSGNVWEWVSSLYHAYPYSAVDGRENLDISGQRVLRGGSWYLNYDNVRTTIRNKYNSIVYNNQLGFRCALSAE